MMKLVIVRSQWLRGEGSGYSRLIRGHDDKKCCLGFLGESLGIKREDMLDKKSPMNTWPCPLWPSWLMLNPPSEDPDDPLHTKLCGRLMVANDLISGNSEAHREHEISSLFAESGVEVEFVD